MSRSSAALANVVFLHREGPPLNRRDRARLELVDLLRELDPDSQRVIVEQLLRTQARIRRHTPAAAIVRGDHRPVAWRMGAGPLWLVGPESRRWLYQRAHG